jgi:hypothetical protein
MEGYYFLLVSKQEIAKSKPPRLLKKIRVCAFERENKNEASLEILAEYIKQRARAELHNLQIALAGLRLFCKVIHFLYLVKIGKSWAHTNLTWFLIRVV